MATLIAPSPLCFWTLASAVARLVMPDVSVGFPVSAQGDGGDATWAAGCNRKLAIVDPDTGEQVGGDHVYISAVVVLRQEDVAFEEWSRRWWDQHERRRLLPDATKAIAASGGQRASTPRAPPA